MMAFAGMTIVEAFREAAARVPERVAIVFPSGGSGWSTPREMTYGELERRAAAVAARIAAEVRGDIVGMLVPNVPAFAWTILGALWAGKAAAILPTVAPGPLLKMMAKEAGVETLLTTGELAGRAAELGLSTLVTDGVEGAGQVARAEGKRALGAAVLLYTSGTTGRPKAVALSDGNILANIDGCVAGAKFREEDVMTAVLPLFHAYGLTVTLLLPLVLGGRTVLVERFAPRTVLAAMEENRATCLVAVPSQYRLLAKEQAAARPADLRMCIAGAERLGESVAQEFAARFGTPVLQGYGATEAAPVISLNAPHADKFGTIGKALPNLRVTLEEDGREVARGEVGELCVAGPNVMLGYYNQAAATAEKIPGGVLHTGDRGFLDAEGYLHLTGRVDDLIKVAGEKVYPAEVEAAIEQIEGVEEAAVVGVADEARGAVVQAYVKLKAGAELSEAELKAACRERVEALKAPKSFVIVEQMPRTASGKVDKKALRDGGGRG